MSQLSPQEVVDIEIKLLQSPGKTLTTLHKHKLIQKTENQITIFKQFDKKNLSSKLKKMTIGNVHAFIDDPNANLRAFSIVILKLIFCQEENEQVQWALKSHLHNCQIDLKKFKQIPQKCFYQDLVLLSKEQSKKILVEFLNLLKYSSEECKIQNQCKKYPLALELLSFFWRTILSKLQVLEVKNYHKKVPTFICFEKLFDLLDIFYGKSERLYFFQQENLFIQCGYQNQKREFVDEIIIGEYYKNEQEYLRIKMKNFQSPLRFNTDNLKFSAQSFNPMHTKHQQIKTVNPFQLIIPEASSSIIMGKKNLKTSNCSLKSSNAFEKRNFNLPNNHLDNSIIMEDSQYDNPTPSFNNITEDQAHDFFQPQNQSLQTIKNQCSTKGTNGPFNMKQSATIISFKNKMFKSSFVKENNKKLKRSLQILPSIPHHFGNERHKCHARMKTDEKQQNCESKMSPFTQQNQFKKNKKQHEQRKTMKRSHSQKNSTVRQSQVTNGDDTNRVSLFDINCKKLKTSMQIDEFDFLSQKKTIPRKVQNLNQKFFNQIYENSAHSCSCSSYKIQKNNLTSNTFAFTYEPQNLHRANFKKKNKKEVILKIQQNKSNYNKSNLNDDFFKKLKAKRQQLRTSNQKNKSDQKHKSKQHQRNMRKPYFTKYSQFIKINERNRSTSKTPDKNSNNKTKTTFQSLNTFFKRTSIGNNNKKKQVFSQQQIKGFFSLKQIQNHPSPKKLGSFKVDEQAKFKKSSQIYSFQQNFYKMYSTPVTPNQNCTSYDVQETAMRNNVNTSLQEIMSPYKIVKNASRKSSFKIFQPKNKYEFGKNDHLFVNTST